MLWLWGAASSKFALKASIIIFFDRFLCSFLFSLNVTSFYILPSGFHSSCASFCINLLFLSSSSIHREFPFSLLGLLDDVYTISTVLAVPCWFFRLYVLASSASVCVWSSQKFILRWLSQWPCQKVFCLDLVRIPISLPSIQISLLLSLEWRGM